MQKSFETMHSRGRVIRAQFTKSREGDEEYLQKVAIIILFYFAIALCYKKSMEMKEAATNRFY